MACNPENDPSHHYFSMDDDTTLEGKNVYDALYFGPLNQVGIYNFCCLVDSMLHSIPAEKKSVLYTTDCVGLLEAKKRAHSVFLCATFAICRLKMTVENIYGLLGQHFHYSTLAPYFDMGGKISHNLDILDCLKAFEKAVAQGLIEFDKFDVQKYNREDSRYNLNWIIPKKLLAMADPQMMPDFSKVRKHLKEIGVKVVVRLNKHDNLLKYGRGYDARSFTNHRFKHYDLYVEDSGIPPGGIIKKFMRIVDGKCCKKVAVHCCRGLGRTGSLISCYLMKKFRFSASKAVGWLCICRPGSVRKMRQHHFLELKQDAIMRGCRPREMKEGVVEKPFDLKSVHKRKNLYPIIEENEVQT